jgi:hypothetical protein
MRDAPTSSRLNKIPRCIPAPKAAELQGKAGASSAALLALAEKPNHTRSGT